MAKILLAQPILKDNSWTDLSVGEPHIIRDILLDKELHDVEYYMPRMKAQDFIYPSPCGYQPLVDFLERKYNAKVVITNGAKQGLGAAFYAAKKMGSETIGMKTPHWALLPPLAELHGVQIVFHSGDNLQRTELVVSPNNPDGSMEDLDAYYSKCQANGSLMIHDGAYYTGIYTDVEKKVHGDVQVFSVSKMLGLSSLRIGYVLCQNEKMYEHIQYYMEHMTVSVSRMPQMFMLNVLNDLDMPAFEAKCFQALETNKNLARKIHPSILELPKENLPGMFLWAKLKNKEAFEKAKLYIIDGEPFGNQDYIRINLAFSEEKMLDIVNRLNSTV